MNNDFQIKLYQRLISEGIDCDHADIAVPVLTYLKKVSDRDPELSHFLPAQDGQTFQQIWKNMRKVGFSFKLFANPSNSLGLEIIAEELDFVQSGIRVGFGLGWICSFKLDRYSLSALGNKTMASYEA